MVWKGNSLLKITPKLPRGHYHALRDHCKVVRGHYTELRGHSKVVRGPLYSMKMQICGIERQFSAQNYTEATEGPL